MPIAWYKESIKVYNNIGMYSKGLFMKRYMTMVFLALVLLAAGCGSGSGNTAADTGDEENVPNGGDDGSDETPSLLDFPMNSVFQETCTLPTPTTDVPIDGGAISTDGSSLGTRGLYHCTGVIMYATNDAGDVIFSLHHYNAPTEQLLLAQKDALIAAGGLEDTIESYATGGGSYNGSVGNQTVIQYANEINLISVAFDLFGPDQDDPQLDVVDTTATVDKTIYLYERGNCE